MTRSRHQAVLVPTAVNFGSTAATAFTVNSPTSITSTLPAGSGDSTLTTFKVAEYVS